MRDLLSLEKFMNRIGRRNLFQSVSAFLLASKMPASAATLPLETSGRVGKPLPLADFQPRSMLHVPETKVPRSRYPVIDIHTHLSFAAKSANGVGIGEAMKYLTTAEAALPLMDRKNIRIMVNLTGGVGKGLDETIDKFQKPHADRFVIFTEPWWERTNQPAYSQFQADEIGQEERLGIRNVNCDRYTQRAACLPHRIKSRIVNFH